MQQPLKVSNEKHKNDNLEKIPELRFPEFNDKWNKQKLKDLCDINKGNQLNKSDMVDNGKYYVLNGGRKPSGFTNSWNVKENTITISEGGYCGYVVFNTTKFYCGGHCYYLNRKTSEFNSKYLYHYLKSNESKIMRLGVGSGIKNIQKADLKNFKINYPSLDEQEKIGTFLSLFDKKIGLLEKKHKDYKNFRTFFIKKTFNNLNNNWKEEKIKNLGKFQSGFGFKNKYQGYSNYEIPFFKVSDLNNNIKYMNTSQNTVNIKMCNEMKYTPIDKPSILIAKLGEAIYLERKRIIDKPYLIDNNLLSFIPFNNINIEFIYYLFLNFNFSRFAQQTAVPSLSPKDIGDIKCFIPNTFEEQEKIANIFISVDKKIELLNNNLILLGNFKKGLLQKMFV